MPSPLPDPTLGRVMLAVAVVAMVAAASGITGRATYGMATSGDEPHYLITAISLGEDGDLDVSDEITEDRYRPFHEPGLKSQAAERPDGTMVVPHDALLPAVLAVPMRWGGFRAAKATLAVLAGMLAALLVWTMVRRFDVPISAAAATTVVFTAAAPLAAYGHQVYPEIPGALAVTGAVAAATGLLGVGGLVVLGLAVVAVPWLAVKYAPVAAVLAVVALVRLWRRGDRPAALALAGALGLAGVAYAAAHLAWYDGLTVYASGRFFQEHGGQAVVVGHRPDLLGRSQRLVGLLVDRGFGLVAWQPAWLLAVPALGALARRRPDGWSVLVAPWAAGWLTATYVALTMHGWWFPGRQTVVVLPLLAIAVGWWVGSSRGRLGWVAAVGSLGVVSYGWLVAEAGAGRLTWIVDFASTSNPWYRLWRSALPDLMRPGTGTWALLAVWTVALAALALWGSRSVPGGPGLRPRSGLGTGPGSRAGARSRDGVTTSVDLADRGAVVRTARGEREDEDGGGRRAAHDRAGHDRAFGSSGS